MSARKRKPSQTGASKTGIARGGTFPALLTIFAIAVSGCTAAEVSDGSGESTPAGEVSGDPKGESTPADEVSGDPEGGTTPAQEEGPYTAINATIGVGVGRTSTTIYGVVYEAELRATPVEGGVKLILKNTGQGTLIYGYGQKIYESKRTAWVLKSPRAGLDVALVLPPGESAEPVKIDLGTDWYRVTKEVQPQGLPPFDVTATFQVTG